MPTEALSSSLVKIAPKIRDSVGWLGHLTRLENLTALWRPRRASCGLGGSTFTRCG